MSEEWRPVVGYEGLYEVSDLGQVRGVDRTYTRPISKAPDRIQTVRIQGRLRPPYERKRDGYQAVGLSRDNRTYSAPVHHLVAAAFHGPRPDGLVVRHLDGDKTNNTAGNLTYGTPLENAADTRRHGTHHNTRKTHCRNGHAYVEANTYVNAKGHRWCKTCTRERNQKRAAA